MIAIEIKLNGEVKAVCGTEDLEELIAIIRAKGRLGNKTDLSDHPEYVLECIGVHPNAPLKEVLKWVSARVSLGDEISIKFIETDRANEPIDRQVISEAGG